MNTDTQEHATTRFRHMSESTAEDWAAINGELESFKAGHVDRIVRHLLLLDGNYGSFPVDRLTHCLQTATRAAEAGEDDEYVVCALLHDIGDTLGIYNHPDVAAVLLQPFVSDENCWMVKHHGVFQGYYFFHHFSMDRNMRDQYRQHPCFERTERFVRLYDAPAFDDRYASAPLDRFRPMLDRVFAKAKSGLYATIERSAES